MIDGLRSYPTMKNSGLAWLGEVPAHWALRRLRDSVQGCFNGIWGGEPNHREDLVCVRVADFDRWRRRVRIASPTIRAIPPAMRGNRLLNNGDLLIEKSGGGDLQPVGVVVLYDHAVPAVCSNFIARMPVASGFDARFLVYVHEYLYSISVNVRSIKQTTGIQNLDSSAYLSETYSFPPLPEQAAIVRFLDYVDRRIRRYIRTKQKLIRLLEEQKQAIIHQAVTRGLDPNVRLRPSSVAWLGNVPEHWEVRKLRHCGSISGGLTPSMADRSLWDGDVSWVTPKDMKRFTISAASMNVSAKALEVTSLRLIPSGSVLLVVRGMILARRVPIARTSHPVTINQDMKAIVPATGIDAGYLAYRMDAAQATFVPMIDEAGHGTKRFPTERWKNLAVAIPPVSEQRQIVSHLDQATARLATTASNTEREIELLHEYRTRLIADVVTGKLDVREAAAQLPHDVAACEPLDEIVSESEADEAGPEETDELQEEVEA